MIDLDPGKAFLDSEVKNANREHLHDIVSKGVVGYKEADLHAVEVKLKHVLLGHAKPKTAEELHDAIFVLTGKNMPYTATSEDHTSPFEWMWRIFKGEWEKSLAWASRESAKTYGVTLIHLLLGIWEPGHEGLHAAGVTRQAEVASKALKAFSRDKGIKPAFISAVARKADFKNGSTFMISPGKYESIDGQHPNTLSMDEVKHWDIKSINQCWGIPSAKEGFGKRHIMSSTNQDAGGGFNFIIDNAKARNIHIAKWSVMEVMAPCRSCKAIDENPHNTNDNAREQSCLLWKFCKGERGRKSTGWKSREEVEEFVRSLGGPGTPEAQTQAFCASPSTKGLTVWNFVHAPRKEGGNWTTITYDETRKIPYYIAMDPSEGGKSVAWFIHYYQGESYVFDGRVLEQCTDVTVAKQDLFDYIKAKGYAEPVAIVVDPRRTDAMAILRRGTPGGEGLEHYYNAVAPPIKEADGGHEIKVGLNELRSEVCNGSKERKLYVNPDTAPDLIIAIKNNFYGVTSSGDIKNGAKQQESYKDEIDAIRYWVRYKVMVLDMGMGGIHVWGS